MKSITLVTSLLLIVSCGINKIEKIHQAVDRYHSYEGNEDSEDFVEAIYLGSTDSPVNGVVYRYAIKKKVDSNFNKVIDEMNKLEQFKEDPIEQKEFIYYITMFSYSDETEKVNFLNKDLNTLKLDMTEKEVGIWIKKEQEKDKLMEV